MDMGVCSSYVLCQHNSVAENDDFETTEFDVVYYITQLDCCVIIIGYSVSQLF
jgi:hypothetical protein